MKKLLMLVLTALAFASASAEIKRVGIVSVFVTDFDVAKAWYTEKLGFIPVEDSQYGPHPADRWVSISPPGDRTFRVVFKLGVPVTSRVGHPGQPEAVLTVYTDDLVRTAAEMKSRGVRFVFEPRRSPWAFEAMVLDSDGQGIVIVEEKSRP